ncbi:MAG: Flp family type IVb pilin, partial [Brevundimonas sp.]|uniref:Flp family type IVb pilin n=1 Tax=Brevundimonas sp. TaxID=1871086 RepID=UPI004034B7C6
MVKQQVTKKHDAPFTALRHDDRVFGSSSGSPASPQPHGSLHSSIKETAMTKFITKFVKDESGATAIEYGL